jgi:hypothetical protein
MQLFFIRLAEIKIARLDYAAGHSLRNLPTGNDEATVRQRA